MKDFVEIPIGIETVCAIVRDDRLPSEAWIERHNERHWGVGGGEKVQCLKKCYLSLRQAAIEIIHTYDEPRAACASFRFDGFSGNPLKAPSQGGRVNRNGGIGRAASTQYIEH